MGLTRAWAGRCWACLPIMLPAPLTCVPFVPVAGFARMAGVVYGLNRAGLCAVPVLLCRKYPGLGAVGTALALGSGFCSYAVAYAQNIMWHDVLLLLPLVVVGLDNILEGRRGGLYIAALALSVFANFYIAFMVCIFLVLYFVWRWVVVGRAFVGVKALLRFAAASLLAGGLARRLVPMAYNLNESKGELLEVQFTWGANFNLPRLAGSLCRAASGGRTLNLACRLYIAAS